MRKMGHEESAKWIKDRFKQGKARAKTRKPFKISSPKSKFFKPKTRLYYTPAGLGIMVMTRNLSFWIMIVIGILIWGLSFAFSMAVQTCREITFNYSSCFYLMYPYSFWLLPIAMICETVFIVIFVNSSRRVKGWIWK